MIWLGDFNGDGKTDVMAWDELTDSGSQGKQLLAHISTGSHFEGGQLPTPAFPVWKAANNNMDIFLSSTIGATLRLGDYNGDGKTDILARGKDSCKDEVSQCVNMYMSTGSNFTDRYEWPAIVNISSTYGFMAYVGDFNGDGMTDIVGYKEGESGLITAMHFSTGSTFNIYDWTTDLNAGDFFMGDIDGDGRTDIVSYGNSTTAKVHRFDYNPSDLLLTVNSSIGGISTIGYSPSDYPRDIGHTLPFAVPVVSSTSASDGRGGSPITTEYYYAGGYHNIAERDFRGFRHVTAYQMRGGTNYYESKTETDFLQDAVLKGMTAIQQTESWDGHTRDVVNSWVSAPLCTSQSGCTRSDPDEAPSCTPSSTVACVPRLNKTVTTAMDSGSTQYGSRVEYSYDTKYLNILEEHKYGAPSGPSDNEVHTYIRYTTSASDHLNKWIVSKPTTVTAQAVKDTLTDRDQLPLNPLTRKWMTYNGNGNITKEEVCAGYNQTGGPVTCTEGGVDNPIVEYEYYTSAPFNLRTVSDPGNTAWKTTFEYDTTTHTYATKKKNALDHEIITTYDYGLGKALTVTPPHLKDTGKPLAYRYDTFGRPEYEFQPEGNHNYDPANPETKYGFTFYDYASLGQPNAQYAEKTEHIGGRAPRSRSTHPTPISTGSGAPIAPRPQVRERP